MRCSLYLGLRMCWLLGVIWKEAAWEQLLPLFRAPLKAKRPPAWTSHFVCTLHLFDCVFLKAALEHGWFYELESVNNLQTFTCRYFDDNRWGTIKMTIKYFGINLLNSPWFLQRSLNRELVWTSDIQICTKPSAGIIWKNGLVHGLRNVVTVVSKKKIQSL